jgi:DNA invertase Pin-like site-specific DNA recombinase
MNAPRRCAIYTRKSSEEGLDQSFNSLDAQREACVAYIQSQRHEGWKLVPDRYDDGGYSGGTLERPALQKLLAAIASGTIDLIVVYKVDRLTRALSDFAKLVELFDRHKVSFVSVTQAFNTTTSMGRLTLNVLLSFAQFEREVTGERIRDKIAASKKKGMWMGGLVPLGYDPDGRTLKVNPAEAEQVRATFRRYLELGSVARLRDALRKEGVRSKRRSTATGGTYGGCSLTSGALFQILTNPIYRGEIAHRGERYPGQHEAIVPEDLWNAVQALRERTRRANSTLPKAQAKHPLLGLLTDERGRRYQAVHTTRGHRRYRYYVAKASESGAPSTRYPSDELELHISQRLQTFFNRPKTIADSVLAPDDSASALKSALREAAALETPKGESRWEMWRPLISGISLSDDAFTVRIDRQALRSALGLAKADRNEATIDLVQPMRLRRTAHEIRLVIPAETASNEAGQRNESLIRFLARGRQWYRQITTGEVPSIQAIAKAENLTERYVARVLRGSLLTPDLMQSILDGRQPVGLTVRQLLDPPPMAWVEQRRHFGLDPA